MLATQWIWFALASAFFAGCTAVLGKLGVNEINSNMATFIRTIVILLIAALIITMRSEWQPVSKLSRFGFSMLVLSGIATGLSWLCYYRALQLGEASRVAPVDKLSVVFVIILSVVFLGEALTWKAVAGIGLMLAGATVLAL